MHTSDSFCPERVAMDATAQALALPRLSLGPLASEREGGREGDGEKSGGQDGKRGGKRKREQKRVTESKSKRVSESVT